MRRWDLLLHDGQHSEAVETLGRAWRLWLDAGLPYESAQTRLLYARALWAEGDQLAARKDLRAAHGVFERLGASLDLERADRLLADVETRSSAQAQRAAKTVRFTDIVSSTDLGSGGRSAAVGDRSATAMRTRRGS